MDTGLVATAGTEDFTLVALFIRADFVVRMVMIALALASVWSWAVAIEKWLSLSATRARARLLERCVRDGLFENEVFSESEDHPASAMARILSAGAGAMQQASDGLRASERAKAAMSTVAAREVNRMEQGLSVLAIIGSTAPFIGLFGTVWGIMNSFRAIAIARETNLAVVAPGIAEALFATALGLAAAIPAVIFYNKFVNDIERFGVRMDLFADDFIAFAADRERFEGGERWG